MIATADSLNWTVAGSHRPQSAPAARRVKVDGAVVCEQDQPTQAADPAVWGVVRLDRADYAALFVSKLGPLVGTWLLENSYTTQGEGEP